MTRSPASLTAPLATGTPVAGAPSPANDAASGRSASDNVFFGILKGLELGRFVPGQRLVETDLVTEFGVGRNSVREALQRLAAEGIVELPRHRGAMIRRLTLQETLDVLDVAERMTGLLARAATRGSGDRAQAQALRAAVQELVGAEKAERVGDRGDRSGRGVAGAAGAGDDDAKAGARPIVSFSTARRRFYRALLDMGGNQELRRLFPTIHMPIVHAQHRLTSLQQMRLADYRRIATAVLAGNPDEAEAAGAAHVQNVRAAILADRVA
ncbi:DNA-binding GntR family transcriptional regulator [Cupriavidus plantarum]|nr:DNA-binding GntR family transcriptional regulator [Cupriavidus plantarum]